MGVEQSQPRRSFLKLASAAGGAVIGLVLAIPGLRYIADPLRRTGGQVGRWVSLGGLDGMPEDHPVQLPVIGDQTDAWTRSKDVKLGAIWVRRQGDAVKAWNAECPHLGCKVGYDRSKSQFACPCHESAFSPAGERLGGPSPRSLDPLQTRIKDGKVEVRFVRFRAQTPEREEIG
ncbi:MAG: Rieske 2Fe-2S domain-containing protein [Myxococcales bacterium]|nr:Rieske 2Fe-2S domain-containing protein [Myxococcales bacterium]MDD9964853.1 Rieske 2Fe-2S domain-containing protein [Myxococcales bacterium]